MKVFAISDLRLSASQDKPMDIFGGAWDNYWQIIKNNWTKYITDEDIVLIAGDISWGMSLNDAIPDLEDIATLPGKKVIIRGNHDYWWSSIGKVRSVLPAGMYAIQNDAIRFDNVIITGTRGWTCPDQNFTKEDEKIYFSDAQRLKLALDYVNSIKREDDIVIGMLHYPPFNVRHDSSVFTQLYRDSGINTVVYGHLHGKNSRAEHKVNFEGVNYYLTSCDQLQNMPLRIL